MVTSRTLVSLVAASAALILVSCTPNSNTDTGSGSTPIVSLREESGATVYYQEESSSSLPNVVDVSGSMAKASLSSKSSATGIIPVPSQSSKAGTVAAQDVTGSVTLTEESDRLEAQSGERVWYTLLVTNQTNKTMTALVVENTLPSGKMTVIDPSGGIVAGDRITWNIASLAPGQSRLLRFQGQISQKAAHNDSIVNIATLRGGLLPVTVTATSEVKVIKKLPQAGVGDFTKPLEDTSKYLKPM